MNRLDELFEEIFRRESPVKVVLSGKRRKSQGCAKVTMRPVESSRGLCFQAEYSFEKKVTHENIDPLRLRNSASDSWKKILSKLTYLLLRPIYRYWPLNRKIRKWRGESLHSAAPTSHTTGLKTISSPTGDPCDFLIRLGVMGQVGQSYTETLRKIQADQQISGDSQRFSAISGRKPFFFKSA